MTTNDDFKLLCNKLNLKSSNIEEDSESKEYTGLSFESDNQKYKFRSAKLTQKKIGHFVTLWTRENGVSRAHNSTDDLDYFLIATRDGYNFEGFIFSKDLLINEKIISHIGKSGKRGIRVYAPWTEPTSPQAVRTRLWQIMYFVSA